MGFTYLLQRDLERAKAFAEEAAALCREDGNRVLLPYPVSMLGWVALLSGDRERAEALHKESLALFREAGGSWGTPVFLEGLACTAEDKGEAEKAAKLFGATQALREAMGVGPWVAPLVEPHLVGARSQLGEGAWTQAWDEGGAMSMETAIEYALSEEKSSTETRPPGICALRFPPCGHMLNAPRRQYGHAYWAIWPISLQLATIVLVVLVVALSTLLIASAPASSPSSVGDGGNPGPAVIPGDRWDAGGKSYGSPIKPAQAGDSV